VLAAPACGAGQPVTGPGAAGEVLSLKLDSAHFRILADRAAASTLRDIADRLEADLERYSTDLGVSGRPITTVEVWTDRDAFYADMQASIGTRYEGATGYVTGATNVTILDGEGAPARASHELAHCVSLRLNPTLGNNPRWLWETVALYENGDRVDPRTLPYLQAGSFPTLAQLNGAYGATRQVYEVGFLLGEFIVAVWGQAGLAGLILANGDIPRVCGVPESEFERRWADFVRAKYL
jgi:hypothetical protein